MTALARQQNHWDDHRIRAFLRDTVMPLRVAALDRNGYPRIVSVWYQYRDGELLCVTHRRSHFFQRLQQAPRVGFELAVNTPPYCGVRGFGEVHWREDEAARPVLASLIQRYLGSDRTPLSEWLLSRADQERVLHLCPMHLDAWDYSPRMADP